MGEQVSLYIWLVTTCQSKIMDLSGNRQLIHIHKHESFNYLESERENPLLESGVIFEACSPLGIQQPVPEIRTVAT